MMFTAPTKMAKEPALEPHSFRYSGDDWLLLGRIARRYGCSTSDVVRAALDQYIDAYFVANSTTGRGGDDAAA